MTGCISTVAKDESHKYFDSGAPNSVCVCIYF
jgi:hypothetical protein